MEEFARQVQRLSGGDVTIDLVWEAGRLPDEQVPPEGVDQVVAAMVQDGELDLGMIPTRAWDTLGVPTLQALNAPFLVTTDELTEQVTGGELAEEMLAGLDEIGLTGLALFPDALRHFFAFGDAIRAASDVEGRTIRAAPFRHDVRADRGPGREGRRPERLLRPGRVRVRSSPPSHRTSAQARACRR